LFNTRDEIVIEADLAGSLEPDYDSEAFSLTVLTAEARALLEKKRGRDHCRYESSPITFMTAPGGRRK